MAVKVHRYLRRKVAADPTSPMVYHLKQVPGTSQTHTIENLAEIIEEKSSLTAGDVIHVTNALVRELKKVLLRGDRVKINGFGIFSLTFNATEVETEKECTVKTINKVNIRFRTDNALRLANESTSDTHGSNNVKFDIAAHTGGNTKKREKTEALVFGGTTEGRKAVTVCDEAAKPYHYSTKGNGQRVDSAHGIPLTGGLEEKEVAAINTVPRQMMQGEIVEALQRFRGNVPKTGVDVTISIPRGEDVAKRTLNPKLGIVGGISIIGTSGIVKPFSPEAFVAAIRREMQVAKALGCKQIVINSGAKSECFIKQHYPDLPPQAFIHYGNFIGETVKIASELDFKRLAMGIMLGKAVKLAEGSLGTHSKITSMNKEFLIDIARQSGCSEETIKAIAGVTTARQLWNSIKQEVNGIFRNRFALRIQKLL
ncbi:Cobalt-precorrin-5B C(1)-methyltransferase [termite gut metagenome]|uniref:Cobalt-precorrin-5B C(1)-methyltransferase n=1 Tax=termite gut metagenome TaxID=433724 RepID=A0A5J4RTE9_9ZZZZ